MGLSKSHLPNLHTQGLIQYHLLGNKKQIKLYKKSDVLTLIEDGYGHRSYYEHE